MLLLLAFWSIVFGFVVLGEAVARLARSGGC